MHQKLTINLSYFIYRFNFNQLERPAPSRAGKV